MREYKWCQSHVEEIVCGIWLIAAFSAFNCGFDFVGRVLVCKAIIDFICVVYFAKEEIKLEKEEVINEM